MGSDDKQTTGDGADPRKDTAAKRRADKLSEALGIDLWAKYPAELMEFRMDRPPKNAIQRQNWKPIHGPKVRVYSTYMRYSWCWPICLEYAVVTDDRDEILRDFKGRPLVLTQEHVSEMLGMSKQRVANVVLDLIADKLIRTAVVQNRQHSMAVYLEGKPALTEDERRDKSTVVTTGVEGPRLEPAVLRRFSSLLNQLGPDDSLITVPSNGDGDGDTHVVRAADYRTLVWKQIIDNRTLFLQTLKGARYSERKAYADTATLVRNLIDQRESPEGGVPAAASASIVPVAEAAAASTDALGTEDPPPYPSGPRAQEWRERQPDEQAGSQDEAAETTAPIIEAAKPLGDLTPSRARRLVRDSRGATVDEIARKAAQLVAEIQRQRVRVSIPSPIGLLLHKIESFFRSSDAMTQWRRECEEERVGEAQEAAREEERRQYAALRAEELEREEAEWLKKKGAL